MVSGYICTSLFCTSVGTEVLDSLFALNVPVWVEGASADIGTVALSQVYQSTFTPISEYNAKIGAAIVDFRELS